MPLTKKIKLGIVSTTIRGDNGYRDWDDAVSRFENFDAKFYIAGDLNSVPFDESGFKSSLTYLRPVDQEKYECSEFIGWKRWARRNIALLEALKDNPDYVLIIDDDNRPLKDYFQKWFRLITENAAQVLDVSSTWFNYLDSGNSMSHFYPRGYPIPERGKNNQVVLKPQNIDFNDIYVFQGISLGDPDIDAFARISDPTNLPLTNVNIYNYAVRDKWSPYNTQNTLFKREIAPLAFTWPKAGRYEDIYSSFVWQHYAFNKKKYMHVGDSINWQERGIRDNFRDFQLEYEGYLYAKEVCKAIQDSDPSSIESLLRSLTQSSCEIISRESNFFLSYFKDLIRNNINLK